MTPDFSILFGGIGLLALWATYQFVWCPAMLTVFRQQVFTLRDEMFLEAANGTLSFHDTAYGILRVMMQGTLRSSGRLSVFHLCLYGVVGKKPQHYVPIHKKFELCVNQMPKGERVDRYRYYEKELMKACGLHLLRVHWPIVGMLVAYFVVTVPMAIFQRWLGKIIAQRMRVAARFVDEAVCLSTDGRTPAFA